MLPTPEMPPGTAVFAYPIIPLVRRHGPRGYLDDEHYKPWLRGALGCPLAVCLLGA